MTVAPYIPSPLCIKGLKAEGVLSLSIIQSS